MKKVIGCITNWPFLEGQHNMKTTPTVSDTVGYKEHFDVLNNTHESNEYAVPAQHKHG